MTENPATPQMKLVEAEQAFRIGADVSSYQSINIGETYSMHEVVNVLK